MKKRFQASKIRGRKYTQGIVMIPWNSEAIFKHSRLKCVTGKCISVTARENGKYFEEILSNSLANITGKRNYFFKRKSSSMTNP